MSSPHRRHWTLDPEATFLNHGAFGACPAPVLEEQARLRARLESQPMSFMLRELEPLQDRALAAIAAFVRAEAQDLGFVANATTGVNAVLRSLRFDPGDEILVTDHAYQPCRNAAEYVAERTGARVKVAHVPFPVRSSEEITAAILAAASDRTRLALVDHVTSPTALVFPVAEIVASLAARGIDTLVDGAHAPGMVPLDLTAIGAAYYTGNCHKWLCAPKAAAFLHVRRDRQDGIVPTTVSMGYNVRRPDRSRFQMLFGWTGTGDPSASLCAPAIIAFMASLFPGGWPDVMAANHALLLRGRDRLCAALGLAPPVPESLLGSMATLPLPEAPPAQGIDSLQQALWQEARIEIPVFTWSPPRRFFRVSAQVYNSLADFDRLAEVLPRLLAR